MNKTLIFFHTLSQINLAHIFTHYLKAILILFFNLRLLLENDTLPSDFASQILYKFFTLMRFTHPFNLFPDLISGEENKLLTFLICNTLHPSITISCLNIFFRTSISHTFNLLEFSLLEVKQAYQLSQLRLAVVVNRICFVLIVVGCPLL
jgi:hypothetical protein